MIDQGSGVPLVLIPGIPGRWEWMRPAVEALARRCRVITYSLDEAELHAQAPNPGSRHFDSYLAQLDTVVARSGVQAAALCGVSYGGLIALRYAAARPARVTALVLASTPSPFWRPNARVRLFVAAPRLLSPLFVLQSPWRLGPEMIAAGDTWPDRLRKMTGHMTRVTMAPFSPARMAERVRLLRTVDLARDCSRIAAPTLVLTGEPGLDRVVAVENTREYLRLIPGAAGLTLERTGHIGLVTRPERFAEIVTQFAFAHATRQPKAVVESR